MPTPKKRIVTKFEKEQLREDCKMLVFQGYTLADAARAMGVEVNTAKGWSAEDKWFEQLARIKQLVPQNKPEPTRAEKVGFDLAATNRQSRAALAQIANLTAMKKLEACTNGGDEIVISDASDFASFTKATSLIAGDWDEQTGNRFAVSLHLNQMVQSGLIRDVPEGDYTIIEE